MPTHVTHDNSYLLECVEREIAGYLDSFHTPQIFVSILHILVYSHGHDYSQRERLCSSEDQDTKDEAQEGPPDGGTHSPEFRI